MPPVFGLEARTRLLNGVRKLTRLVAATYGPCGGTVMIQRFGGLLSTKDGYTVAHEADFEDPLESMGAKILREACKEVNDAVGDGTTTTAILACVLAKEGHKQVVAGTSLNEFIRGVREATSVAIQEIQKYSFEASPSELQSVSHISSNYDMEVSGILLKACLDVGKYGTVVIEDGQGVDVTYDLKEGMELDAGYTSQYYITNPEHMSCEFDGPLVALLSRGVEASKDMISLLEEASTFGGRPILVIAPYVEGEAQATMALNASPRMKGHMQGCVVRVPGVGMARKREVLEDLAAMSGATVVDPDLGMDICNFNREWFGGFRKSQIFEKKSNLTAYEDHEEATHKRILHLSRQLEDTQDQFDADLIRKRIAKLSEGYAVISIGGHTEAARKERRARIEDSLGSLRSAMEHGVCLGGGSTYFQVAQTLDKMPVDSDMPCYNMGVRAVSMALKTPIFHLMDKSNSKWKTMFLQQVQKDESIFWGYDAHLEVIRDFREDTSVVDPSQLLVTVLQSAVSVAIMLLTVEVAVTLRVS